MGRFSRFFDAFTHNKKNSIKGKTWGRKEGRSSIKGNREHSRLRRNERIGGIIVSALV
jgi:hypothetical protein